MRQLLGTCELALDQLKANMRKILNGGLKAQITEWWLKKIETKVLSISFIPANSPEIYYSIIRVKFKSLNQFIQVNEFLQAHGYEFTAVPDNYIEQPPENLENVRVNLAIVTKTLDPLTPHESSPRSLIKELRDEIS